MAYIYICFVLKEMLLTRSNYGKKLCIFWVYVKRGTHPEPAGTSRNHPEPTQNLAGTFRNPTDSSWNHPEPHEIFPEPPGTLKDNQNNKNQTKVIRKQNNNNNNNINNDNYYYNNDNNKHFQKEQHGTWLTECAMPKVKVQSSFTQNHARCVSQRESLPEWGDYHHGIWWRYWRTV